MGEEPTKSAAPTGANGESYLRLADAIQTLRRQRQTGEVFGIVFLSQKDGSIRKVERCRLRSAARDHFLTDAFLYFTDEDTGEPKQCRKRLIRSLRINDNWHNIITL